MFATHADETVALLLSVTNENEAFLENGATSNRAVLHSDPALMPKRRRVWSSWNFISDSRRHGDDVSVCLDEPPILEDGIASLLALNPVREPSKKYIREFDYAHPFFDTEALATQSHLWSLQGYRNTWYCGSYFGAGFHEDALQSGLAVGEQLGGQTRPWDVPNMNDRLQFGEGVRASAA